MQLQFIIAIFLILIGLMAGVSGSYQNAWDDCTWTSANGRPITDTASINPQIYLAYPANILQIGTNHWNQGNGTESSGTISLIHEDGTMYGPWQSQGQLVYNVSNTWWWALPDEVVKSGNYTIIDSDRSTLSANKYSQGIGFSSINYDYMKPEPEDMEAQLHIERIDTPTSVNSCESCGDIKVYWNGYPYYPLTLYILPASQDLKTYDWKTIVSEYKYTNYTYPLYVPCALSCCQVDSSTIRYDLVLVNGNGIMSDPFPLSFKCLRYYLK